MKYTVYLIRHISTGKVLYVGKTNDFKRRVYEHLSLHSSAKEWLSVIGTGNVSIEPVAEFSNEVDALKYEDELILKYSTITNGYNKCRSGLIYKENPKEYEKTDIRKESRRKCDRERRKTDKRKEYMRNYQKGYQQKYQRDYRIAKKLGITIEEYRKINTEMN